MNYKEHPLAEILRAIADGKPLEFRSKGDPDWKPYSHHPETDVHIWGNNYEYRVKPKEPVKTWRWVAINPRYKNSYLVTDGYYSSLEEYNERHPSGVQLKFIQKVVETEIEVME